MVSKRFAVVSERFAVVSKRLTRSNGRVALRSAICHYVVCSAIRCLGRDTLVCFSKGTECAEACRKTRMTQYITIRRNYGTSYSSVCSPAHYHRSTLHRLQDEVHKHVITPATPATQPKEPKYAVIRETPTLRNTSKHVVIRHCTVSCFVTCESSTSKYTGKP